MRWELFDFGAKYESGPTGRQRMKKFVVRVSLINCPNEQFKNLKNKPAG